MTDEKIMISCDEIKNALHAERYGSKLILLPIVDSTNRYAKLLAQRGAQEGTTVLTEWQYSGHGRMERIWQSSQEEDIAMSIVLRPDIKPEQSSEISIFTAIAIRRAIKKTTSIDAEIKWPNDLLVNGKKICGILGETGSIGTKLAYLILGIGLNVNGMEFDEKLLTATSLRKECGKIINRNQLIAQILDELEIVFDALRLRNERAALMDEYKKHNAFLGKRVYISDADAQKHYGVVEDFDDGGAILLRLDGGEMRRFLLGEASLRCINAAEVAD